MSATPSMSSKERLLAAIRFEGPDRVPVCPRMWRYLLAHEKSQKPEAYLKYASEYGLDPLLSISAGPVLFVPDPRSDHEILKKYDIEVKVTKGSEPDYTVISRTFITPAGTLTDRTKIPRPGGTFGIAPNNHIDEYLLKGPDDLPALQSVVKAWTQCHSHVPDFRRLAKDTGGKALIQANTYSALSHNAGDAYPMEKMMMDCYDNPDFIHALIDTFHQPLLEMTKKALENGVEMVYCSTFYESMSSGWSPELYRKFFLPRIKQQVDAAHEYGSLYHHYDDGKVGELLPLLKEIGVDLVSTICPPPSGNITLAEARRVAGNKMCLNGGIDTVNVVWRGTPAAVEASVKEAIEQAALAAGGYIVGTSDSITEEAPVENVQAFFNAVKKYGKIK